MAEASLINILKSDLMTIMGKIISPSLFKGD